jgi:hypothetical protein
MSTQGADMQMFLRASAFRSRCFTLQILSLGFAK